MKLLPVRTTPLQNLLLLPKTGTNIQILLPETAERISVTKALRLKATETTIPTAHPLRPVVRKSGIRIEAAAPLIVLLLHPTTAVPHRPVVTEALLHQAEETEDNKKLFILQLL